MDDQITIAKLKLHHYCQENNISVIGNEDSTLFEEIYEHLIKEIGEDLTDNFMDYIDRLREELIDNYEKIYDLENTHHGEYTSAEDIMDTVFDVKTGKFYFDINFLETKLVNKKLIS